MKMRLKGRLLGRRRGGRGGIRCGEGTAAGGTSLSICADVRSRMTLISNTLYITVASNHKQG